MNVFGTSFNYNARLEKIRKLMDERDIDCILVHKWPNQYYVSGYYAHLPWYPDCHIHHTEAPLILFKDRSDDPVYLCTFLTYNAVNEGTWIKDVRAYNRESTLNVYEYIAKVLEEKRVNKGNIGVEEDCCTISTLMKIKKHVPEAQFKDASEIFYLARSVKEPEEIKLIKKSVSITESALKVAMEVAKPGVTEMEVQRAAEMEMKRGGAIREVESMCQSGFRTANYRAFGTVWKKIKNDDLVMVDIGCNYMGYGCDLTRTWVVGKPSQEQKKIANDLYDVYDKVLNFIKPGLSCHEVADYAGEVLKKMGYSTDLLSFPHQRRFSIHGVGLGPFHELPDVEHKDILLKPGMTIALQPSIRHEKYTIRFEDDAIITPTGIELMTELPRELI